MSKAQHDLKQNQQQQLQLNNQDLVDLNSLSIMLNENNFVESLDAVKLNDLVFDEGNQSKSVKLNLSLYQYKQNTISSLQQHIESLNNSYTQLLMAHNSRAIEIEEHKRNLCLKVKKKKNGLIIYREASFDYSNI